MPKYESYQEGFEKENLKKIDLQNKELEKRMKLEESLNVLATFAIIAIILTLLVKALVIFGIIDIASTLL